MKRRAFRLLASAALAGAFVGCVVDLNPQPLPPGTNEGTALDAGFNPPPHTPDGGVVASPSVNVDAGSTIDGGLDDNGPAPSPNDAGADADAGDADAAR